VLPTGTRIAGRFEILAEAGRGGMGMVFRAQDRLTRTPVAVKVLRPARGDEDDEARFAREARVLGELDHPGIVRHIASGDADGLLYLVMEWLDGETLMARLDRDPLSMAETVELARQVAAALAHAHERGLVHRDVKPSNLMAAGASWKLVDFGIARRPTEVERVTATGVLVGTAGYMSPEQARGERHPTSASDVFSLGCVLYECLTGRAPFTGANAMAVHAKILLGDPQRPSQLAPAVPPALDELVLDMLAKRPDERPTDLLARLAALPALPAAAPPPRSIDAAVTRALTPGPLLIVGPPAEAVPDLDTLAREHGGGVERLASGGIVIRFAATDRRGAARRAAELALRLQALLPGKTLALAASDEGDVVDSAVTMLATLSLEATLGAETGVWLDPAAVALVEDRFEIAALGARFRLLRPRT